VAQYDRNLGISYWTKNYLTGLDQSDVDAADRVYPFYDPIDSLPAIGQAWWRENREEVTGTLLLVESGPSCPPQTSAPHLTSAASAAATARREWETMPRG
jgi:lysine 2,3-aminomutase